METQILSGSNRADFARYSSSLQDCGNLPIPTRLFHVEQFPALGPDIKRAQSERRNAILRSGSPPRASCEQFQQLAGLWNLRDCSTWNNFQRLLWRSDGEGRLSAIYFGRLEGLRDQPSPTELFHVEQFPIIWPVQPVAGSPKIKSAYDPKVTSARQPSPRTAYEPENRVSRSSSKEISGNFVVIESSYPCKHWP